MIASFDEPPHVTSETNILLALTGYKNGKPIQMTVWCKPNTIFKERHALRIAGLIALCVALITTLFFVNVSRATAGINETLSYSGRLLTASGSVVPDGHYNIQFKIYQDGTGTTAGNNGGTLKWTETYINDGGTSGVEVTNGFFSVDLGSNNAFGSSVDWNQDTLWLSMNVAGSSTSCTTYNSGTCTADGEMLPMKRITSTPYAMNAGQLGGKTASNFVQLGQGVQTDASTNSSIYINKTSTGNLVQLQNAGSDVFNITNSGDVQFGNGSNHSLYVGTAAASTDGSNLTLFAGYGGSGTGNAGGKLFLQGGGGGGTDGNGGDVVITGGAKTGTGANGGLYLGTDNTNVIQIGSTTLSSGTQTINIGNNNTSGGTTNVTIGTGGSASGGTTILQSKDDTTIATNDTQRARFSGSGNTLYLGNADTSGQASTANSFTLQGTSSTGSDAQGGSLTLQGGSATNGNANGGNLTLSGGSGVGTGTSGLVVISTPTFSTVTNDTNCFTSGSVVASSCTFTTTSVNGSAVLVAGFSADGQVATLPDPTNTTAGRIIYVTAANGSNDFTLRANSGAGTGIEQNITMRQNTTVALIWNGSDWTTPGTSNSTSLQDAYNNTFQTTGDAALILNNTNSTSGFTIRDSSSDPINSSLLNIQNSSASTLFSVNSNVNELATDPGAETAGGSASTFPSSTWSAFGFGSNISRNTTTGNNVATGKASTQIDTTATWSGALNQLNTSLTADTTYSVSLAARAASGTISDFQVYYSKDGTNGDVWCNDNITITSSEWTRITCTFTASSSGITSSNGIFIGQNTASSRTFYVDNLSVRLSSASDSTPNVQIGGGSTGGPATLFTLDKSAAAPNSGNSNAMLGSMYYDTTIGKVQCYEAGGWGSCGDKPDNFVTISPEYSNAVTHGTDLGTLSSDLCSASLSINDGTSGQPTVCGSNETYNFYNWTSAEVSAQTKDIFVTYKLPSTFSNFVAGSASLAGRTDSSDSSVAYQVYKKHSGSSLTACGSSVSVSTGSQTTWQSAAASGSADPSACSFTAGDSIVFKITLSSLNDANAYVSDLNFTFSNQ